MRGLSWCSSVPEMLLRQPFELQILFQRILPVKRRPVPALPWLLLVLSRRYLLLGAQQSDRVCLGGQLSLSAGHQQLSCRLRPRLFSVLAGQPPNLLYLLGWLLPHQLAVLRPMCLFEPMLAVLPFRSLCVPHLLRRVHSQRNDMSALRIPLHCLRRWK